MTLEELKELGAVILLPNKEAYSKCLVGQNSGYTRTYFYGIRVLYGDFNWDAYQKWISREKVFLDDVPSQELPEREEG